MSLCLGVFLFGQGVFLVFVNFGGAFVRSVSYPSPQGMASLLCVEAKGPGSFQRNTKFHRGANVEKGGTGGGMLRLCVRQLDLHGKVNCKLDFSMQTVAVLIMWSGGSGSASTLR